VLFALPQPTKKIDNNVLAPQQGAFRISAVRNLVDIRGDFDWSMQHFNL
jgi:hypothetical protein